MRTLGILVLGGMMAGAGTALAAEDHNSTRSNEGRMQEAPANHNTTRSNKTAPAAATDDSDSAMMSETKAPRDAASGLPTGKRQHKP